MSKVQIICSSPGLRRNGAEHPASAFYDEGHWTKTQLEAFDGDPAFTVRLVDDEAENVKTDVDFRLAVDAEVSRKLGSKMLDLHASFSKAVEDAVVEKTATIKADADNAVDAIGKQLSAANEKITSLEADLAAAKKPAAAKK